MAAEGLVVLGSTHPAKGLSDVGQGSGLAVDNEAEAEIGGARLCVYTGLEELHKLIGQDTRLQIPCGFADEAADGLIQAENAFDIEEDIVVSVADTALHNDCCARGEKVLGTLEGIGVDIKSVVGVLGGEGNDGPRAVVFFADFFVELGDDAAETEWGAVGQLAVGLARKSVYDIGDAFEGVEGVPTNVEAEELFLELETLGEREGFLGVDGLFIGGGLGSGALGRLGSEKIEEAPLPCFAVFLSGGGLGHDAVHIGKEGAAVFANGIEGARLDEVFEDALVGRLAIDASHKVPEVFVRAVGLALFDDRLGSRGAYALDAGQAEKDFALT